MLHSTSDSNSLLMDLARYECTLRVVCVDDEGRILPLAETNVPAPSLRGPFFENPQALMKKQGRASAGQPGGEVLALQHWLTAYGYYEGKEDAWYGAKTDAAVREFQRIA